MNPKHLFWRALRMGNEGVVQQFLKEGMDPNQKSPYQNSFSPIVEACRHGQTHLLPILKAYGATVPTTWVNPTTGQVRSIMEFAWESNSDEMAEFLLEHAPGSVTLSRAYLPELSSRIAGADLMRRWWVTRRLPLDFGMAKTVLSPDTKQSKSSKTDLEKVMDTWCACGWSDPLIQGLTFFPQEWSKTMYKHGYDLKQMLEETMEGFVVGQHIEAIDLLTKAFPNEIGHYPLLWKAVQKNAGLVFGFFSNQPPFQSTFELQWQGGEKGPHSEMFRQCLDALNNVSFDLFALMVQEQPAWDYTKTDSDGETLFHRRFRYTHGFGRGEVGHQEIQKWFTWLFEGFPDFYTLKLSSNQGRSFIELPDFKHYYQADYLASLATYEKQRLEKACQSQELKDASKSKIGRL